MKSVTQTSSGGERRAGSAGGAAAGAPRAGAGRGKSGPLGRAAWEEVDWKLRDAEIARRLGVSREAARQARKRLGEGAASPSPPARFRGYVLVHRDELHGLTVEEAMRRANMQLPWQSAWRALEAAAVRVADPGAPTRIARLDNADWRLPDSVLGRIWHFSQDRVSERRRVIGAPPATWDARRIGVRRNSDYHAALKAEAQRAAVAPGKGA